MIALEPNETFEIVLKSDEGKPREGQPRFIYRYLTCRQWRRLARFQDQLELQKNADNVMDAIIEAATTNLIGWVNIIDTQTGPVPFDIKKFEDIVTMFEAQEIILKLLGQKMMFGEKKRLDLQPGCDMAGNVSTPAGTADSPKNANTEAVKQ